jgi:hypothetical protein
MAHSIVHRMMSDDSKIGTSPNWIEKLDFRQTIYESLSRVRNRSNGSSKLLFGMARKFINGILKHLMKA